MYRHIVYIQKRNGVYFSIRYKITIEFNNRDCNNNTTQDNNNYLIICSCNYFLIYILETNRCYCFGWSVLLFILFIFLTGRRGGR